MQKDFYVLQGLESIIFMLGTVRDQACTKQDKTLTKQDNSVTLERLLGLIVLTKKKETME